jgi:hypothetical protein
MPCHLLALRERMDQQRDLDPSLVVSDRGLQPKLEIIPLGRPCVARGTGSKSADGWI